MAASDNKLPMNIYVTRQEKAELKAEAKELGVTMMDVVRKGLDHIIVGRRRAGKPVPRPVPVHRPPWREKLRKKRAKA